MKQHFITLVISTCGTILGLCIFGLLAGFGLSTSTVDENNVREERTNNIGTPQKYYYIDDRGDIHTSRNCISVVTFGAKRVSNKEPFEYESICYKCVSEEEQNEIEALAK